MTVRLQVTIPASELDRFNSAAGARGMTQAEFQVALMNLHDAVRKIVDKATEEDDPWFLMEATLTSLGLQTVVR